MKYGTFNNTFVSFTEIYRPFHLHNELAYQIKAALNSWARSDVDVRIELPFDRYLFIGGLQQAGKLVKRKVAMMFTRSGSIPVWSHYLGTSGTFVCLISKWIFVMLLKRQFSSTYISVDVMTSRMQLMIHAQKMVEVCWSSALWGVMESVAARTI